MLDLLFITFDALAKLAYGIYQIISGISYVINGFIYLLKEPEK